MASKKPTMFTRKWYLNDLLKIIFGLVKVNYTEPPEDVQILERSGLADKFTYDSVEVMARSQSKMNKLFI